MPFFAAEIRPVAQLLQAAGNGAALDAGRGNRATLGAGRLTQRKGPRLHRRGSLLLLD